MPLSRGKGRDSEKGTKSNEAALLVLSIPGLAKEIGGGEAAGELLIWILP